MGTFSMGGLIKFMNKMVRWRACVRPCVCAGMCACVCVMTASSRTHTHANTHARTVQIIGRNLNFRLRRRHRTAGLFTFLGDVDVDVNYIWEM